MMRRFLRLAAALLLVASALGAESFEWNAGTTGWSKGDLTLVLTEDGVSVATTAVTLTEVGSTGVYTFGGLTDATDTTRYTLSWTDPHGREYSYTYPRATATPQAITYDFRYGVRSGDEYAVGDSSPDIALDVTGLAADPTGGTATFSMWCNGANTPTVDDQSATISNAAVQSDGTYSATFTYDTQAADTATAGTCRGRFTLVQSGDTISLPPQRDITVRIYD